MEFTPPVTATEDTDHSSAVLIGIGASHGTACGTARTVHSLDQFPLVRPGDVLVCRTTDPAWTPLFGMVAAVITETGGMLSHAAIVAREYGIPAVLGIADGLTRINTGTTLIVDGTHGIVHQKPASPGAAP